MATQLRIKRRALGGQPGAPSSLLNAELAFNENDRLLYIGMGVDGSGNAQTIVPITGAAATLPSYTGNALKVLRVNASTSGIEWSDSANAGVNSVSLSLPSIFTVTGSPITAASGSNTGVGTLSAALNNQNQNFVFAAPSTTGGTPTFRLLAAADIPSGSIPLNSFATPTATINLGGNYTITNVPNPTNPTDIANKQYVDGLVQGLNIHDPVKAATIANITLTNVQAVDGVNLSVGDRVLVRAQTNAAENGIYTVQNTAWTRATDADVTGDIVDGSFIFVERGNTYADTSFVQTNSNPINMGSTSQNWVVFATAGSLVAGNGLTKTGNNLDVVAQNGIYAAPDYIELTGQARNFHNLATNGFVVRYGADLVITRSIVGTANQITVADGDAVGGNPQISISSSYSGQSSISTVGVITSGEWKSATSTIGVPYGGTGATSFTAGGVVYGNNTGALAATSRATVSGSVLQQDATGNPFFSHVLDGGTF